MERLGGVVTTLPIRSEVVQQTFQHFCETGLLPEEQLLAEAVCTRALRGKDEENEDPAACIARALGISVVVVSGNEHKSPPSVRECLFHEAVFGEGIVSRAARGVLKLEVRFGADVTDPNFLADRTLPDYGTVGLHLLGFPHCLVRPTYEDQAQRLFARYDELRVRINRYGDDPWFDKFTDAVLRFQDTGDLPDDELLRDVVLADAELDALWRHRRGHDVAKVMAALDRAAKARGPKRAAAIAGVQELVRAERILPE